MITLDITDTLAPKSEQLDNVELITGPRTFTITSVDEGSLDQPVNVWFADFPRPWRPGVIMRRLLAACWGTETSAWHGHRVRLFRDPDVAFGKDQTGGTRVSHLSHIDGRQEVRMMTGRAKYATFTVDPLEDDPSITPDTLTELGALFASKGIPEADRLTGAARVVGHPVQQLDALTEPEAHRVISALQQRPDKEAQQ